jgi:hypothetical protein
MAEKNFTIKISKNISLYNYVKNFGNIIVRSALNQFNEKSSSNQEANYKKLVKILKNPLKKENFDNYIYWCLLYQDRIYNNKNNHFNLIYELHKAFLHRHLKSAGTLLKINFLFGNETPNLYYYNGDFFQQDVADLY